MEYGVYTTPPLDRASADRAPCSGMRRREDRLPCDPMAWPANAAASVTFTDIGASAAKTPPQRWQHTGEDRRLCYRSHGRSIVDLSGGPGSIPHRSTVFLKEGVATNTHRKTKRIVGVKSDSFDHPSIRIDLVVVHPAVDKGKVEAHPPLERLRTNRGENPHRRYRAPLTGTSTHTKRPRSRSWPPIAHAPKHWSAALPASTCPTFVHATTSHRKKGWPCRRAGGK
eukprot:scaffold884_cov398-Prasinococcus_capsulatus_cf.AAC.5